MSSTSFQDNPPKKTVREQWNTPFLKYIHSRYNVMYRYMGFPGTELIDVRLWKDMIQEVIAFELLSPGADDREWIKKIRRNLKVFGIRGIAYLGSLEEVVILGKDLEGQPYKQDNLITLYNLDFCDEIGSAVDTKEQGRKRWRYEAIRVILQDQERCHRELESYGPSYFILLLTVRNQMNANILKEALNGQVLSETSSYCSTCEKINPIPTSGHLVGSHGWAMKAFLYETLAGYFKAHNISVVFLPVVKYKGNPKTIAAEQLESPMFHWMVLCKFGPKEASRPNYYPAQFLDKVNSLDASNHGLSISIEPGEVLNRSQKMSPVAWFQDYEAIFISGGKMI